MGNKSKNILLANPRGFCFGVKNAIKIVDQALQDYPNKQIYVINEIVHNKTIVEELESQRIKFTQNLQEVPTNSVVIFSAHGVAPQIKDYFKKQGNTILDATCPLVKKVHEEVLEYSQKGYHIIYIGKKDHDEAKGVIAEKPENISVIENELDISKIEQNHQKYIILTQTTLNMFYVEELYKKIKQKIPQVEMPDKKNLCHATTERQLAVKELAPRCDLFLVIGSQNSSNSQKLKDIAAKLCPNSYLIDSHHEIRDTWIENIKTICLTAGASAPENLIEETISFLKKKGYNIDDKKQKL